VEGSDLAIFAGDFGRTDCQTGSVYYYHNDHLGTPQKMTDVNGAVVWSADYRPFGQADVTINTVTNNFRFPGQYEDKETGLHYNWHRYYEPGIGRYLRADPSHSVQSGGIGIGVIGIPYLVPFFLNTPQELNVYAYTVNNPVRGMDPLGLFCGSGWLQDLVIPDSWWEHFDFSEACKAHDKCYSNCESSKKKCDNQFWRDMLRECSKLTGGWRIHCESVAGSYVEAVRNLGNDAFDDAQKANCCP